MVIIMLRRSPAVFIDVAENDPHLDCFVVTLRQVVFDHRNDCEMFSGDFQMWQI
jgi:hypothetical protein